MKLLGVSIDELTQREIMTKIEKANGSLFIVTLNPEILLHAWHDKAYQKILNSADVKVVDGVGIVILARLLYGVKLERFPGADLAERISAWAEKGNKKIFLLGGTSEANKKATKRIMNNELRITGIGGKFSQEQVRETINSFRPDVVLVALGAPKQEFFINNLIRNSKFVIRNSLFIGVGGTVDFWAYPYLRAPKFVRHMGLEWLWRLILQPWRIFRIMKAVFLFPLACLWERLRLQ